MSRRQGDSIDPGVVAIEKEDFESPSIMVGQFIYIYIYIYANFIKHNRHFMSTYFLLDPFEFPYYFYRIREELIYVLSINQSLPPNTIKVIREFERIQKKICRHKMSIMFNEICINEEMLPKYIYIYIYNL